MSQPKPAAAPPTPPAPSPFAQQISLLHLRVTDLTTQINTAMKALADENAALRKENADLKSRQQQTGKQ